MSIFAFEPEPKNVQVFRANIELNRCDNVMLFEAGLAATDSNLELFLSEDNFGDHQIYDRGEGRASVSVKLLNGAKALDNHLSKVDVLKIDTQGAGEVISGLMPLLKEHVD